MQNASAEYKTSMRLPYRGRANISVYIGVVNLEAQKRATVSDSRNKFAYFSNETRPFNNYKIENVYATAEQNFAHVDGSMLFLPRNKEDIVYQQGIVTEELLQPVYAVFNFAGLDIKGLTIDFGEYYPTDFTVENDKGIHAYNGNVLSKWRTEDVFLDTSFLKITPIKMINGQGRLRINEFMCGIANVFTGSEVANYSFKDFVSPISESLPSQDMNLEVYNYDLYYSVDNPESTLGFMEIGQEIKSSISYDIGNGNYEMIDGTTSYLKSWSANDKTAKFVGTDVFDNITTTYNRGKYRPNGISLYDLALDVITDAKIDAREHFIDPYLKSIIVYNPLPVKKHTEALQMIANAGRCVLLQNRKKQIQIKSSFLPNMVASASDQTEFSKISDVLLDTKKNAYGMASQDFTPTDGSMFFMPRNKQYLNCGYVSESVCDANGVFATPPKITLVLEAGYVSFGLKIRFREVKALKFTIKTYFDNVQVESVDIENVQMEWTTDREFKEFDKMEILFTKGSPNSRITVDNILIGDITDYTLTGRCDFNGGTPTGKKEENIKSISVQRTVYSESKEAIKDLKTEDVAVSAVNNTYTVSFTNPSYGFIPTILDNTVVTCTILDSSDYFLKLRFNNITTETVVKLIVKGFEYVKTESFFTRQHDTIGIEKQWKNPLISTVLHATAMEEWLAEHYLSKIDYSFNYRGDPRIDANDLFYMELKDRETCMIRAYENTFKFNGAFSGSMKARRWSDVSYRSK